MHNETEQALRNLQLLFMGKIIAGFTHEMKNYLAIIKESSGLMQDLISMGKSSSKKDAQPLVPSLQLIDEQIDRSIHILNHLNRFAHRMDRPSSSFLVHDIMDELMVLISRFANQKKIILEKDFQKNIPAIVSDPARLQCLIYCLIEEKLNRLDAGSKITLQTSSSKDHILIRLIPKGTTLNKETENSLPSHEVMQEIIRDLHGEIAHEKNEEITIKLPLSRE